MGREHAKRGRCSVVTREKPTIIYLAYSKSVIKPLAMITLRGCEEVSVEHRQQLAKARVDTCRG